MRWGKTLLAIMTVLGLAACDPSPRLAPLNEGLDAPEDLNVLSDGVDPLIVGHRLMEAGEYDLALRSYLRAAGDRGMTGETLSSLGSANLQLGRLGQAEELLRRAVEVDPDFVPAWNNLGVVLMEQGEYGEARQVFRQAYALDSGESDSIRENLRLAIARMENPGYSQDHTNQSFDLERRGGGRYLLLYAP
ncbi:tetratricopeptide repeat protein [Nioella ostreopsis]|jgi:Flp pilus assembly protein TadD|uniref:tetratricopeptide repeat protein n=1 Tax=Nioella ostreopsis TaxID=2448479 RepID=UPI000FDAC17D|nr:tetratricopeptide repeat protein [Nioella ostreopsis]